MTLHINTFPDAETPTLGISDAPRKQQQRNLIDPSNVDTALKFYPTDDGTPVHVEVLQVAAQRAAIELVQWIDWLNTECLPDKIRFLLKFDDYHLFDACIGRPLFANSEWRDYPVVVGLGCLPVLMSISNLVSQMVTDDTGSYDLDTMRYTPVYGPMGMLTCDSIDEDFYFEKTTRIAIDALILILLHEATHGCRAHLHFPITDQSYKKAMESDADWGAGYMFVKGLLAGLSPTKTASQTIDSKELAERLVSASQTNLLGFQSTRTPADPGATYHLPYTRSRCTVFGAKLAWEESETLEPDFFDSFNNFMWKMWRCDDVFSSASPGWIGHTDQRTVDDWNVHDTLTLPRVAEMRATLAHLDGGPTKAARLNYPLPQPPEKATSYANRIALPSKLKTLTYRLP